MSGSLPFQIHSGTLVRQGFDAEELTWEKLGPSIQEKFVSWAPRAEELLEDPRAKSALLKAWIWHILDENILSHRSKDTEWLGPHWQAQDMLQTMMKGMVISRHITPHYTTHSSPLTLILLLVTVPFYHFPSIAAPGHSFLVANVWKQNLEERTTSGT